jgi:hypothetical protein
MVLEKSSGNFFVITMQWHNGNPKCNVDSELIPTLISSPIGEA